MSSARVAFHDHPLFVNEDRLSASLRMLFGRYRAKMESDDDLYLRRRLSASLSALLQLRCVVELYKDLVQGKKAAGA